MAEVVWHPAMSPKYICVSIHDVAPSTWPACEQLLRAVHAVVDIPLTLLVVPHYHRQSETAPGWYQRALHERAAAGDELALHGYTHLDESPRARTLTQRMLREVYTRNEGEFAALSAHAARVRLECGRDWFARHGLTLHGFVAPAWLLSDGAWEALKDQPLLYTTTWRDFYLLPVGPVVRSPSLAYGARNAWTRCVSRLANSVLARHLHEQTLVRLSLHPADAAHVGLTRHWQRLLASLMVSRCAVTKAQFARSYLHA